jgi:tetratricopeptide (TPR) repeat protein
MDDLGTGWEHQRAGRLSDAEACYRRFLAGHPDHAGGWAALGVVAFHRRDLDQAIGCYLRSLELMPGAADVLTNLGVAHAVRRDFAAAERWLRQAAAVRPPFLEAHRNLGHALRDQGKFAEAAQAYQQARTLRPDDVDVLGSLGIVLRMANRPLEAIEPLSEAVRLAPRSVLLHQQLGVVLASARRFEEARAALRHALALNPTDAGSHNAMGIVLAQDQRFDEAEASYREAIRLNPRLVEAHQNLGNVFRDQDRYDEALARYATAIELRPDGASIHNNLGVALARMGRHEDAIRSYDRALAANPRHADARKNRAMMKLLLGDYAEGFAEFEWRWMCSDFVRPDFTQPLWKGEPIAGKTILLIAEQGLGDTIQFIRFAPRVKALGATVVFRCPAPLARLFADIPGIDVLIPDGEPLPAFDAYVPLVSLAAIFRTSLEDLPGVHPVPYLRADPGLVESWADRLGPRAAGELRVGIFWQGNPANSHDRFRSAPLAALLPLATVPGVRLISVQKGHGVEQIAPLTDRLPVLDLRDSTRFEDTAALMSLLDLTITICSAPAHLAGALGVPTWLALSRNADWRWLDGREDSPWYHSVRIFRQSELHNWDDVFRRMARALAELPTSRGRETINSNLY